jgi:hypothetical protein
LFNALALLPNVNEEVASKFELKLVGAGGVYDVTEPDVPVDENVIAVEL